MESEQGAALEDLAERLRASVGEFVRHVRERDTMPTGQVAVLGHLARAGAHSIAELARLERVKHQSMTRTVNLLAEQRLVALGPAENDRRRVVVSMTGRGSQLLELERSRRASAIAESMRQRLNTEELAIADRIPELLDKLRS